MLSWGMEHYIDYRLGWARRSKDRVRWFSRLERMDLLRLCSLILRIRTWEQLMQEQQVVVVTSWSRQIWSRRLRFPLLLTGQKQRQVGGEGESPAMLRLLVVELMSILPKRSRRAKSRIMRRRGMVHHCLLRPK